jgi:hypothetical protein
MSVIATASRNHTRAAQNGATPQVPQGRLTTTRGETAAERVDRLAAELKAARADKAADAKAAKTGVELAINAKGKHVARAYKNGVLLATHEIATLLDRPKHAAMIARAAEGERMLQAAVASGQVK